MLGLSRCLLRTSTVTPFPLLSSSQVFLASSPSFASSSPSSPSSLSSLEQEQEEMAPISRPRIAAVIIGDEILTGKVVDKNINLLATAAFAWGAVLTKVEVVPDDKEEIVSTIQRLQKQNYAAICTTGGIGPTHDDITYESVAASFNDSLEYHQPTLAQMDVFYKERDVEVTEARKRMALLPSKATILSTPELWVPLVVVENVYVFPGIPHLFERMLPTLKSALAPLLDGLPAKTRRVFKTDLTEGDLADTLTATNESFPDIDFGSYPQNDEDGRPTHVHITIEGDSTQDVLDATDKLMDAFQGTLLVAKSHDP